MRRTRIGLAACVLAMGVTSLGFTVQPPSSPAPHLSDPTRTAAPLVNKFFLLVEHQDVKGLGAFLSPAFQIERADGSGGTKAQYLANLPTINSFAIANLTATQTGSVLVVTYQASIQGVVNGKPATPGPAPRLSVFAWNGKVWQLVGHANFNPLTG